MAMLSGVGGTFRVADNPELSSVAGFSSLAAVGEDFRITNNVALPTCSATSLRGDVLFVGGSTTIAGNLADACGG
jgi:hypothetical protein